MKKFIVLLVALLPLVAAWAAHGASPQELLIASDAVRNPITPSASPTPWSSIARASGPRAARWRLTPGPIRKAANSAAWCAMWRRRAMPAS